MILSAGLGERMLPLTLQIPKPALPVLGRPLIVEILGQLVKSGVTSAAVNLHHLPSRVTELLGDGSDLGLQELFLSHEERILGTAGGIRKAAPFLRGGGTILVRNADFLADIDLRKAIATHLASGCPATIVVRPSRPGYSVVEVDSQGRVLSLGGVPKVDPGRVAKRCLFTGCHLLEEEVLEWIPENGPSDIVREVYYALAAEGKLAAHFHQGSWWEFGSPADYLEASLSLIDLPEEERNAVLRADPVRKVGNATVALGPGADFHGGVDLRGRAALGFASFVAEGSYLEDTVVMPEAWIGPGCRLRRSIVGPGTEINAGFEGTEVIVCPDPDPHAACPRDTIRWQGLLVRPFGKRPA